MAHALLSHAAMSRLQRAEFEKLALEHLGELRATALRFARNEKDADDLVQETMLRALAAWAWADQGWEHCVHLQEWLPLLRERLAAVDPGPEAFSLAYLHLAGHAGHDDLQRSIAMLEGAGYLLEAAGFAALAGQHEGATHHLERYRKRRESTLANLAQPPEVRDMADGELASRLAAEADLLSGDSGLLARQGVFPM